MCICYRYQLLRLPLHNERYRKQLAFLGNRKFNLSPWYTYVRFYLSVQTIKENVLCKEDGYYTNARAKYNRIYSYTITIWPISASYCAVIKAHKMKIVREKMYTIVKEINYGMFGHLNFVRASACIFFLAFDFYFYFLNMELREHSHYV